MAAFSKGAAEFQILRRGPESEPPDSRGQPAPRLDPGTQALFGAQLRRYYVGLLAEPIPQRLIDLVDRLVQKGGRA